MKTLKEAADKAYLEAKPIMSNEEYDVLFGDIPTETKERGKIKVKYPRINIKKNDRYRAIDKFLSDAKGWDYYPKFDGAGIRIGYKNIDGVLRPQYVTGNPGNAFGKTIVNKLLISKIPVYSANGIDEIEVPAEVVFMRDCKVISPDTSASGEVNAKSGRKESRYGVVTFPYTGLACANLPKLSVEDAKLLFETSKTKRASFFDLYMDGIVAFKDGSFKCLKFSPEKVLCGPILEIEKLRNGQMRVRIEPIKIASKTVEYLMVTKVVQEIMNKNAGNPDAKLFAYLKGYTTPQLMIELGGTK